jgi:hypothetical protein
VTINDALLVHSGEVDKPTLLPVKVRKAALKEILCAIAARAAFVRRLRRADMWCNHGGKIHGSRQPALMLCIYPPSAVSLCFAATAPLLRPASVFRARAPCAPQAAAVMRARPMIPADPTLTSAAPGLATAKQPGLHACPLQ